MDALNTAITSAANGLSWGYPCLIWLADYLKATTGRDPAEAWRALNWNETLAKTELAALAEAGTGDTEVERALDAIAHREGWQEADAPMQGAVMVGVFTSTDGIGVPAIYDGDKRWLIAGRGDATLTLLRPVRMWSVPNAA